MKTHLQLFCFWAFLIAVSLSRFWMAQWNFERQKAIFPHSAKGVFRLWIAEEPEVLLTHERGSHETGRGAENYQTAVKEVRAVCVVTSFNGTPITPVKARVVFKLTPYRPQPLLSYGENLNAEGEMLRPSIAMNPGQFDYAQYLKTKGIAYVAYLSPGSWQRAGGIKGFFLWRWACGLKREAENQIVRVLPYPENALLSGILLGDRVALPEDVVESFFVTGTIHILAVSGMITGFVAGLFFTFFRVLQLRRKWAALLAIAMVVFFILITGAHPPVCRAGLFSILALTAVVFERRVNGGVLLLSTAFILIMANPFVIEDLSFQISFLATAGLMVMANWMMEKLSFLPRALAWLVTASAAAQLAVWCLIIYDFNQMSVYSVLSNVVIVPLALFVTAGGLALLAGSFIHPWLGTLLGAGCFWPLKLLVYLTALMERWPLAQWIVASPPLIWVLVFHFLLLTLFFFYWPRPQPENPSEQWKRNQTFFLKGRRWAWNLSILFILSSLSAWGLDHWKTQPFKITFLAVGHGNAVVLQSPQGKVFVVDGGKESKGPDRYQTVVAYLRHEGVQKVDGVLNTHPDEDHVGGLLNVVGAYPVSAAYEGSQAQSDSHIYESYEAALRQKEILVIGIDEGSQLPGLEPVVWNIIHPAGRYHPHLHPDNNRSVVSKLSFGGLHLILPGDLEKPGLLELLKNNKNLAPVDWLMAPHHGRNSGEPALCEEGMKPRFVVLSDYRDYPQAR
ncbi:MAG TPA: ComEC/Rec2 family competence protein, partial [bacterium]|nr:ComEC/Rec2 family competence protein [bacterium]